MSDEAAELYFIDGAVPETPGPDGRPAALERDASRRQAAPRIDAYERVSGAAVYPPTCSCRTCSTRAILRCPHAHARVKKVDTRRGGEDARRARRDHRRRRPARRSALVLQPRRCSAKLFDPALPLRGRGGGRRRRRHALPGVGRGARRSTSSTRCCRSWWTTGRARSRRRPAVHDGGNRVGEPEKYERGDVAKGFAEADVVAGSDATARRARSTRPMEPHGCVARWDGPRLIDLGLHAGRLRRPAGVAASLELPLANVRVIGQLHGRRASAASSSRQVHPHRGRCSPGGRRARSSSS